LQLLFRDGGRLSVSTKDGFFLFRVPDQRLVRTPPTALVVVRGRSEIARERFLDVFGMQLLTPGRRPAGAIMTRARRVIVRRTRQGPAAIFLAPSKFRRAHCWWLHVARGSYGSSCVRDSKSTSSIWSVKPLRLSVRGHEVDVVWGRIGSDYPRLGLRFQDGRRRQLARTGSYYLYVVSGRDRARGHRPASVVARDASGRIVKKELLLTFTWAR